MALTSAVHLIATGDATAATGSVALEALTANTNDYALAAGVTTLRVTTDQSRNLTGIVAGAAGQRLAIVNVGSNDLVLVEQSTSTASNQILSSTGVSLTLAAKQAADLEYDATSARWRAWKRN